MPWQPNPGHLPDDCVIVDDETGTVLGYRKVHVRLFGGTDTMAKGHHPWPAAGGKPPTVWTISHRPHPFEIKEYLIA